MQVKAVIIKNPDTDFGVSFPDFPGCITTGRTLCNAIEMAKEAIAFHIEGLKLDGSPVPEYTKSRNISVYFDGFIIETIVIEVD